MTLQVLKVERRDQLPIVLPCLLDALRIALRRVERLFLRGQPRRWRTRHIVGTLTRTPVSVRSSAQLLQGQIGMVTDQLADQDLDGLVHAWGLPAGMGLRGNAPRRPLLA